MKNKKGFIIFVVIITLILEIILFYNYFNYINFQKEKEKQIVKSLNKDEINKDYRKSELYDELYYDIVLSDCNKSDRVSSNFDCELMNSVNKKKYYVSYYSSYMNTKNRVVIKIDDVNSEELNKILDNNKKTSFESLSELISGNINGDYKINIVHQSIDNIKYDILISRKIKTLKDKTGDNGTQYIYELANTIEKIKYTVYCDNYVEFYNNKGVSDKIKVDITYLSDNELDLIIRKNTVESTLNDFKKLINSHFPSNYEVDINYKNR